MMTATDAFERCAIIADKYATKLRADRDTFRREGDEVLAGEMEDCATVADDIAKAIRTAVKEMR